MDSPRNISRNPNLPMYRGRGRVRLPGKEKFQGKEIQVTLQAPSREDLDSMLEGLQRYTSENGMDPVEILQYGLDPDGGWKAIISAHNWNPITWLKERFRRKPKEEVLREFDEIPREPPRKEYQRGPAGAGQWMSPEVERAKETVEEEKRARRTAEELKEEMKEKAERARKGFRDAPEEEVAWWRYARTTYPGGAKAFDEALFEKQYEHIQREIGRIPPKVAKEFIASKLTGLEEEYRQEAEAARTGASPGMRKIFIPKYNPHTQTWDIIEREIYVSPKEALEEARRAEFERLKTLEDIEALGVKRRARPAAEEYERLAALEGIEVLKGKARARRPIRVVGRAAGKGVETLGLGVMGITAAGMKGVATGAQRGLAPGRAGPARAARMVVPQIGVPGLYGIRKQTIDLSRLRGGIQPKVGPSLEYLKGAVLPRMRRPPPTGRIRLPVGTPTAPSLERLKRKMREEYPKKSRLF